MTPDPHNDETWNMIVDAYTELAITAAAVVFALGAGVASLIWWLV